MQQILTVLAEPNRTRIIELLARRPYSVNDLAHELGIRQPQASKHLRALHQVELVRVHPKAQQRIYSLQPAKLRQLERWLHDIEQEWTSRLDKLDNFLQSDDTRHKN